VIPREGVERDFHDHLDLFLLNPGSVIPREGVERHLIAKVLSQKAFKGDPERGS